MIRASFTECEFESECSWLCEAQRDCHNASFREHDATILLQELHSDGKEERLDEWIFLILGPRACWMQQLPARFLRTVRVDEHARLRQKIEVIVPASDMQLQENKASQNNRFQT